MGKQETEHQRLFFLGGGGGGESSFLSPWCPKCLIFLSSLSLHLDGRRRFFCFFSPSLLLFAFFPPIDIFGGDNVEKFINGIMPLLTIIRYCIPNLPLKKKVKTKTCTLLPITDKKPHTSSCRPVASALALAPLALFFCFVPLLSWRAPVKRAMVFVIRPQPKRDATTRSGSHLLPPRVHQRRRLHRVWSPRNKTTLYPPSYIPVPNPM